MSVLDTITSGPTRAAGGPTQYRPLREALSDDVYGRLQLVERIGDGERFVVSTRVSTADPVTVANTVSAERHRIAAASKALDESKPSNTDQRKTVAEAREALKSQRKALAAVSIDRAGPTARAIAGYSQADGAGR